MARPRTIDGKKILGLPKDIIDAVRDYRFEHRINTESEAYRRLIEAGLKAERPMAHP